ncbi:MAG TPA: aspartyl protease family protein [Gammaproteobacteria bacterium]|nr:aspartyl protease family protein [Gammaproteobacteria bacterium]
MAVRIATVSAALIGLAAFPLAGQAADCKIGKIAELPVTMNGLRPMVTAQINGVDAQFIADSGAFYSTISPASAAELKLRLSPSHIQIRGITGSTEASITTVKEFTLAGVPIRSVEFIVGGAQPGRAVGLLGQNVFRLADVEYDLAHGAIRLMRPEGCDKRMLAYWAQNGEPYSEMEIAWATQSQPHTTGTAFVNGARIHVMFDTGSAYSMLSLRAAERAGLTPDTAGVVKAGLIGGFGARTEETWIAPVDAFKIGDEEIKKTKLRFGDINVPEGDMLIGTDFFLSHRIYVASSQRKLYFTYNGGPVFNLTAGPVTAEARPSAAANSATPESAGAKATLAASGAGGAGGAPGPAAGAPDAAVGTAVASAAVPPLPSEEPTDAAGFSRRGVAYAARRDFEHAIADLTRACELAPTDAEYFYQRAEARLGNRQPALASADLDHAITLKPDYVPALVARAGLRLNRRDATGDAGGDVLADLDKVNLSVAKEADVRLALGNLYARAGSFEQAIEQYDKWLDAHLQEIRTPEALASRCRVRAMLGENLDKALADCNRAIKERPQAVVYLDSRGLTYLRKGEYDKALKDYDTVLASLPRNPWALYGRGLVELHNGNTAKGQADIAASKAVDPRVEQEAAKRGIVPKD